jgi:hypothetical protein
MNKLVLTGIAAALTALSIGVVAQQAPQPPPREDARPAPPAEDADAGTDDVFIPTEELAADEEVTFPVDI